MHYTNTYNLPKSFTDVIDKLTYNITLYDQNRYSATTLIQPPRIRQLTLRHWNEIEDDYANHIWRVAGSAYHFILAKTKQDNRLIEEKIEHKIDDSILVTKPDLYDNDTQSVEDYKFTTVWAVKGIKREWEEQLNIYDWSLEKSGFKILHNYINAILRDWSEAELKQYGGDYPPIPFKRIEVPLWSLEKQEEFVKTRLALHKKYETLSDLELPICSPEERWATENVWAIYKNTNKKATKLLPTESRAKAYLSHIKQNKENFSIKKREGIDNRCIKYCSCNKFCSYYKEKYAK